MKKRYIALIILAVLIAIVIAALKIAPDIAKDYVVEHSEELIGRKMKIASVDFSPLTFTVTVDDFAIFEQDGTTPFVAFEKFRVNVNPTRLINKEISVSEIYLKGLYTQVVQDGERFNFSDILDKFAAADSTLDSAAADSIAVEKAKADSLAALAAASAGDSAKPIVDPVEMTGGFDVAIENIILEKGNIIYQDRKVGSKIHLQDFFVEIPAVYFNNKNTDIGVNLKFADGGDLSVKVLFNMQTQDFNVALGLKQFALACAKPYLKDFINYKDFSGSLNVNLNLTGNVNDVLSSNVVGTVGLNDIVLTETSDKTIGVNSVQVGISKVNLNEMDFVVDSVVVDGAFAHLDLLKGGKTNFDILLNPKGATADTSVTATDSALAAATIAEAPVDSAKADSSVAVETPKSPAEKSKPLKFVLNKLQVKNTTVSANDFTIKQPFNYKVSGISVNGSNINFNTPCTVTVGANFPEGGTLSVKYKGALSDLSTMDAYISVKNLALKHFSPYSYHFTGYPIISGTMAFASDNKINKFNLGSKNTIDIYNIDVGDKVPDSDPEFTVPMKVGLYILKDKDDKIQFDVPVQGNLQDPEFSYVKIVWKTVMNLLIKVALSPLKVVGNLASSGANAVGIDMGKNDEIIIDPLSNNLESEQYAKAIKMVSALAKDPKLKMDFVQSFNMKKTVDAYKTRKLKTEFYKSTQGKTTLNELDEKAIIAIADKDEAFVAYVAANDSKLDRKTLEKELLDMASKRNAELLKTLQQQKGVTKKNVTVTTAPRSQLVNHKGKANYKVQIDVQ
ncbi:MAG: DUF748 domain-containing protein [Fibrobacter sp.]|nr:DUF748 domain-containing protein [Fibrobacter sp.]